MGDKSEPMIVEKGTYKVIKGKGLLESESLGSCVAVAALDKKAQVGGLWIFVLPASKILSASNNGTEPTFFADEGLDKFLTALEENGADLGNLQIVVVGGARFLEAPTVFDLGGLNASMIRKLFKDKGISGYEERLGGPFPRRVSLDLSTGKIVIKSSEEEEESW